MFSRSSLLTRLAVVVIAVSFVLPASALAADKAHGHYAPDRVLVGFKQAPGQASVNRIAADHSLRLRGVIPRLFVHAFDISDGRSVAEVVDALSADPRIAFAEPDHIRYAMHTPNDPLFPQQWDMTLMGLPSVWDVTIGAPGVTVAVLDTGIALTHSDLVDQLWVNAGEIPGNAIDDDGNGYIDDVNGYDFAGDGIFPLPGAEDPIPYDTYVGHGTHVSGTVAAEQDNGVGISGVAPGVKLMTVRVLGGVLGSGYSSDIAEGIVYATDNGAQVINMSLGGSLPGISEYLALKYAWDNNVLIAAASGNDGGSGNGILYPASFSFTTSVGATDNLDNIASFSTHNIFVEVSAPGDDILSTVPPNSYEDGWSGTSMATPHVAGLAALLYSVFPDIENWEVRSMLQSAVVDRGVAGWDEFYGYGRVSGGALLTTPRPTGDDLEILTPPNGGVFPSGSILAFLWNPVNGAASYRIIVRLPSGGIAVLNTPFPYYTHPPSAFVPTGGYTVMIQARDVAGALLSSDVVSFFRQ